MNWFLVLSVCLILAALLVLTAILLASKVSDHQITGWGNAPLAAFIFPLIGCCWHPFILLSILLY
jgi:hypothetical protein